MLRRCRHRVIRWTLAAWVGGALLGCKGEDARPAALGDCNDEDCAATRRSGGVYGGGGNGLSGDAGSAGSAGVAGAAGSSSLADARSLTGTIQVVAQSDLTANGELDSVLSVRAAGANMAQVTTNSALDGSFRLDGADPGDPLWVGVGAFDGNETSPLLDTLQPVAVTRTSPVELLVVRRDVLEQIAANFTNNPPELDPGRGSIILRVVSEQGAPVPQVQLRFPAPGDVAVAYDVGDAYSDQVTETSARGTLVLLNMPAGTYPGTLTSVTVQVNGANQNISIRTIVGGVSVVTAVVLP
jgi:hypothetical protein